MSKIRLTVRNVNSGNTWNEEYDKPGIGDNGNYLQAEDWAHELIRWFNDTRRPQEARRELIKTEVLGESNPQHKWVKRTDGMSVEFRGRLVDLFSCVTCGITGKRFSLNGQIKRDSKYKAKKFEVCKGERGE